ncbi:MAG: S8 family serine peptidase [Chthoniobacterales bacterium]|nr:S8 family serine peptidase [Chthoniobacterales bacterium]
MNSKKSALVAIALLLVALIFAVTALLLPNPVRKSDAPVVHKPETPVADPIGGATRHGHISASSSSGFSADASAQAGYQAVGAATSSLQSGSPQSRSAANPMAEAPRQTAPDYTVQDAGLTRNFVLALDELWVTDPDGKGRVVSVNAASPQDLEQLVLASSASGEPSRAVLYEEGVQRNEFTRRVVSSLVTVQLSEGSNPVEIAQSVGASSFELPDYAPGFAVLKTGPGLASLRAAQQLNGQPGILLAEAQLARQQSKKAMPNDTLINQQWHHKFNSQAGAVAGTDLNIETAWAYPTDGAGRRGRAVRIGIVDDGLQTSHPDLITNVDTTNDKDWNGNDNDPNPGAGDDHGTACAGDAAARGNNGIGVSGSAPEATLVGMRLIAAVTTDTQEAEAMNYLPQLIQIKSNSWGPNDTGTLLEAPGPLTLAAFKNAAEIGRGGNGTIFLWAAGNGLDVNDNSNYDGYANSIYTIAVGAFDSQSRQAWYSESGANLVIVSPSSGTSPALGKTTTDRTGANGYVAGDYESDFGGTSSATPTAAGVVALMLEAKPNLGWRDVQEILMRSAKKVNPGDTDWKTPVAPDNINHNHKFGAGLSDATAAVNLAVNWSNLTTQLKRTIAQTGLSVAIPNQNTTGITREFVVAPQDNIRVEHATVTVNINHTAHGNLKVTLTSPSGTVSRLAEVRSDSNDNYTNWTFMTVRNWGENASGTWRLKVTDESGTGNTTGGSLTSATLEIFGASSAPVNPPPSVALTSPVEGAIFTPGTTVIFSATASDLDASGATGIVQNIEFLANGAVIGSDNSSPYNFAWQPAVGSYAVTARATDTEGASSTTAAVSIQVLNQRPVVTSATISPLGEVFADTPLNVSSIVADDADGDAISCAYQWQSSLNGAVFSDAMGLASDTLPASPERSGSLWRCRITSSDAGGAGVPFVTTAIALNRRPPSSATVGQAFSYDSDLFLRGSETSFVRKAILSEFSQGPSGGTAEWIEFLVLKAGSLRGWKLQDAGGTTVTLANVPAWDNIPAGTLVVIYNGASKDPLLPADDLTPGVDAKMIVSSADATMGTGSWPSLSNNGDGIILRDETNAILSQVGYGSGATQPNIGAVSGARSANYRGNTEDGGLLAANWSVQTATTTRGVRSVRAPGDLFISEYVEGTSNNKAIELYNPSSSTVDLGAAGFVLEVYFNGATTPANVISLVGTVAAGSTFVLKNSSAVAITAQQSSGSLIFNGDDAIVLKKGTAVIDVFGQVGLDPGAAWGTGNTSTADKTLRRKSSILVGDTLANDAFDPSVQWDGYAVDTFTGLGSHTVDGGAGGSLALSIAPTTFAENAGTNAATGTLTLNQAQGQNLVVSLASSDTSEVTVPASVTIPVGQTTATFALAAVDDTVSDGPVSVTITATAGSLNTTASVTVIDNEVSLDGVTPGAPNGGDNTAWVQQLRSGALNQPALFRLGAGNPVWLSIDPTTGALSGTPSASGGPFTITLERYNTLGETASQSFQLTISSGVTGFAAWIAGYPGLSDPTGAGDPDNDRVANIAEYLMGMNPGAADAANAMTVVYTNGSAIHLDYRRDTTATGITNWVKWKNDLASPDPWSNNNVSETVLSNQSNFEWRRATVPVQPGEVRMFLRLEVQQQ